MQKTAVAYLLILLSSFGIGLYFITLFKRLSISRKVFIKHDIPLVGGMALGLSFAIASCLGFITQRGGFPQESAGIISAALIMLFFGIVDDYRELSIPLKFIVQILAATILIFSGIRTNIVYIGWALNIIITYIWIIGITNAFNHLDVMDGLAGGGALLVSLAFFIIALINGDTQTAILTLGLTGAVSSFLIFNLPPAKIYMGNSGSHFLGFLLAAVAVVISYASMERKLALLSPIVILGFPILDTGFLIYMRARRKRSIFQKSDDHLILKLVRIGCSKRRALLYMLGVCLFFSFSGIIISQVNNYFSMGILFLIGAVSCVLVIRMRNIPV